MKTILKYITILVCMIAVQQTFAQSTSVTSKLDMGKVEPYSMEVTYNKTTHLIFPATIRYVDLGSDFLVAEDVQNVLRIKAAKRDFEEETNFSVITEDGRFYNFNVHYSTSPTTLNYDLLSMQKAGIRENNNDVLFEELGNNSPSLAGLLLETIYIANQKNIKHIAAKSYGIKFNLKGLFVQNGKFYFHTELSNSSNVPFQIDFINFKIVDKKVAKRTVVQEKPLTPLRIYKPLDQINGKSEERNVFLLDQFTITDDKVLLIEIFEKNGGRYQTLEVENSDLVNAKVIKDMNLKIN
ncbi:conjugative transposon protein TraN [Sphingobacterium sp.]|uniref:conjugative transposon protein TraN n=1 Tax=Sphingobacterium sp. TaxID=341027 RepID=UPI0025838B4B|nr:conjugative transposon protein TraN [Sphingobacterium sp.]WET69068.1 MAG: conjugative transposon protein TraN [Sphingobacterium sp.]